MRGLDHVAETHSPSAAITLAPRAQVTNIPELCGFYDGVERLTCDTGSTCMFNTDYYIVGCCSSNKCDWITSCCNYNPNPSTLTWGSFTSQCGGPISDYDLKCTNSEHPFCATLRFENGFTRAFCTSASDTLTETAYFTSSGDTVAWAGLPRLTGSNGPPTSTSTQPAATVTQTVRTGPNPGAIAGSVVGGAAFGAIAAIAAVWLVWFIRRRRAPSPSVPLPQQQEEIPPWSAPTSPFKPPATTVGRPELPGQPYY